MPIYEYECAVCGKKTEKITQSIPKTVPAVIKNWCGVCEDTTRHNHAISMPAVVGHKPGSNPAFKMRDVLPTKDKSWKKRVLEGKGPDGRPLTNRIEQSAADWQVAGRPRSKDVYGNN